MNSFDNKCNELKWNYDKCFYTFLDDYIVNKRAYPEGYVPCEAQLKPYQACVSAALIANNIELTQTAQEVQDRCRHDIAMARQAQQAEQQAAAAAGSSSSESRA